MYAPALSLPPVRFSIDDVIMGAETLFLWALLVVLAVMQIYLIINNRSVRKEIGNVSASIPVHQSMDVVDVLGETMPRNTYYLKIKAVREAAAANTTDYVIHVKNDDSTDAVQFKTHVQNKRVKFFYRPSTRVSYEVTEAVEESKTGDKIDFYKIKLVGTQYDGNADDFAATTIVGVPRKPG